MRVCWVQGQEGGGGGARDEECPKVMAWVDVSGSFLPSNGEARRVRLAYTEPGKYGKIEGTEGTAEFRTDGRTEGYFLSQGRKDVVEERCCQGQ